MIWYSLSVSVSAGATVIESPVCTPIGSRFSIEQMMMQLSFLSRTTSISNSFQPITDSSISTSLVGEASRPRSTMSRNSSLVIGDAAAGAAEREGRADDRRQADRIASSASISRADVRSSPPPAPSGQPGFLPAISCLDRGDLGPARGRLLRGGSAERGVSARSVIASRNSLRSSALSMASAVAPIICTLNLSSVPCFFSDSAQLSAVCPPMVGSSASGRSFSMILATISGVIGSI